MTSLNLFRNPLQRWFNKGGRETVPVKALGERDRRRMLRHFLSLERPDRILRFGSFMGDEQIAKYVNGIDFGRDMVFGVYNRAFRLAAVGHLAFSPRQPSSDGVTEKDRVAEFGVSVLKSARGMGIGSKLFERAAIVCRNHDVDTLYMHCLSSNQTMMHIAKKAGMEIHRDYGEADAYLKIGPANPASVLQEAMQEQLATLDYALKANVRRATKLLDKLPGRAPRK
ncbi:GNAT family N-acetyltransferase [Pseudoduganella plicata]|uniref:N-acetyltransferase n=1 Tax=Pseudoduganella plicata TaxID=321984 RepID=A0A4V1AU43_9BURK|nr:GNAT family N-acetyltransferase [Pseudoduganella plicata]QBQ37868.1 GNAT family N-acetyltransferase [Pseudoduganella plicata]GGY93744.1 N-acetyltransferase [Pseudoduganella plicata]